MHRNFADKYVSYRRQTALQRGQYLAKRVHLTSLHGPKDISKCWTV